MEINLDNLRENLKKDQDSHKQEQSLIMKENVQLLQEINDLRKQKHSLEIGKREIQKEIEKLHSRVHAKQNPNY